jgi:hypothetical protein
MHVRLEIDTDNTLVVHLREGGEVASVAVSPPVAGLRTLRRALDAAMAHGYGECFWPARAGGQYWWIFKRDGDALETIAMWTRGGASLWEHVFRATDEASYVHDRLAREAHRVGLT